MKTAVSLPDEVFYEAERVAQSLGVSRSQLYASAIAEFVAQHQSQNVTQRLNEVHAKHDTRVDPVLDALQLLSLPPDEW